MKIGKRLLLLMLLFIPFVHTNAMTSSQEKALKETMDAFLRNNNIDMIEKSFGEDINIKIKTNKKGLELIQDTFTYNIKILKL